MPVIEIALGTVDGLNKLFTTTVPFLLGSIQVFLNGLAKRRDYADGWTELPPNTIRLGEAPQPTDVVQVYYLAL